MTPTEKPLINLIIDPTLIKRIDDFRFKHRFASRAAAMRWLMAAALREGLAPGKDEPKDA